LRKKSGFTKEDILDVPITFRERLAGTR